MKTIKQLMFRIIKKLRLAWNRRKRYDSYDQMPDGLLVVLGGLSFLISVYYGYVLTQVMPDYMDIANSLSPVAWGWQGWLLTVGLGWTALATWHFGSIAWKCNELLRSRWYA